MKSLLEKKSNWKIRPKMHRNFRKGEGHRGYGCMYVCMVVCMRVIVDTVVCMYVWLYV